MTQNFWCTCEADIPAGWGKLQSSALSAQTVSLTLSYRQAQSEQKSIILLGVGKSPSGERCPCTPPLPFHPPWAAEGQTSGFLSFQWCLAATAQKLKLSMHFKKVHHSNCGQVSFIKVIVLWCSVLRDWTALMWRDDISQTSPSAGKLWDPSKQHLISYKAFFWIMNNFVLI